jgi:hypothetical protein
MKSKSWFVKSRNWFLFLGPFIVLSHAATSQAEVVRVGVASAVKENVSAFADGETPRPLIIGEDVFFNERVVTTKVSSAVLQFRDRSTLEVGPNATLVINRSVYNPVESVSEKTITVVAGAFRFVSGVAVKSSQTDIRTPAGTLGIRGSVVIGTVSAQGDVVLLPVQGTPTWTNSSGTRSLPQGGALVATRSNGQTFVAAQVPASFARVVRQVMSDLGVRPPALLPLSPAQRAANARDHLVSVNEQRRVQARASDTAVVQPLTTTGVSAISELAALAKNGLPTAGISAEDQGGLAYLASVLGVQTVQHDANQVTGEVGVVQELYTVMTAEQIISIASSLAALDPAHATAIAVAAINLLPGQTDTIIAALNAAAPGIDTAAITQIADRDTGQAGAPRDNQGGAAPPPTLPPISAASTH